MNVTFSSVQSLNCVQLFVTPWIAALQASLSITNSQSSPKLMSIESVMPSSHLILCHPLSSCPQSLPASESLAGLIVVVQSPSHARTFVTLWTAARQASLSLTTPEVCPNSCPLWALESITTNKASGGDRIPVELFQILKDEAVKVLYSICQKIWKTQQWSQDWKKSVFIPIPKKSNAKECSNYRTIALISHANKVMLKIVQARLQQYVNCELTDVQAGFRKGRGTRDQIANIH